MILLKFEAHIDPQKLRVGICENMIDMVPSIPLLSGSRVQAFNDAWREETIRNYDWCRSCRHPSFGSRGDSRFLAVCFLLHHLLLTQEQCLLEARKQMRTHPQWKLPHVTAITRVAPFPHHVWQHPPSFVHEFDLLDFIQCFIGDQSCWFTIHNAPMKLIITWWYDCDKPLARSNDGLNG